MNALTFCILCCASSVYPSYAAEEACPFNTQCKCTKDDSYSGDALIYATAVCDSVKLPDTTFSPSAAGKYKIMESFKLKGDVSKIPDNHFAAFEEIRELNLNQAGDTPVDQNWGPNAFANVKIVSVKIDGLSKLGDLMKSGDKNLQSLSIGRGSKLQLSDSMFQNYPALTSLALDATEVTIDDNAFAKLNDKFAELSITQASLKAVPSKALSVLKNLGTLNLTKNGITEIAADAFSTLTNLANLLLMGNPITDIPVDKSPFTPLDALTVLDLSNTNLAAVDLSVIASERNSELLGLNLNDNKLLSKVTVSVEPSKFPDKVFIAIENSKKLDTIDPKIGDILNLKKAVAVSIKGSINLRCENLNWTAPYACDGGKLMVQDAKCGTPEKYKDKLLSDYLKDTVPNACPQTTAQPVKTKGVSSPSTWISAIASLAAAAIFLNTHRFRLVLA